MMRKMLVCIFLLLNYFGLSQVVASPVDSIPKNDEITTPAKFNGGEASLQKYIYSNIQYPAIAIENNIQGRVIVRFIIKENGEVTKVEIVKSVHPSIDKEAIRVIKRLPRFKPAEKNEHPVRVRYTLPITFKLS